MQPDGAAPQPAGIATAPGIPCEDAVVPEGSRDSATPESVGCKPASGNTADTPDAILRPANILVCLRSEPKEAAIRRAGELLVAGGYATPEYADAMLRREELATTYMDSGIAIPHGTSDAKGRVLRSGIVVLQYPDGVAFGDEKAHLVVGIAGVGDAHLDILARLAGAFGDEELLRRLTTCTDPRAIYEALK